MTDDNPLVNNHDFDSAPANEQSMEDSNRNIENYPLGDYPNHLAQESIIAAASNDQTTADTTILILSDGQDSFVLPTPPNADQDSEQPSSRSNLGALAHLAGSTMVSLSMVLGLLLIARLLVPSLVESARYSWHRGELRAEYELSGERLQQVSLSSLTDVSKLVSQRLGPSVVHINLMREEKTHSQLDRMLNGLEGQGSGFVIREDGYILTNNHVIAGTENFEVLLRDGRRLPAVIVGADPLTDLAVLKVDAENLLPVMWGKSDEVEVGTPVWAVGSPFGLQQSVTFGIISSKHRVNFRGTPYDQHLHADTAYGDLMQSDVALNPGNSGGPLVNSMGEVVGVNTAILGETYHGISFSIPSRVAQKVAENLLVDGEVHRGWLGIRMAKRNDDYGSSDTGIPAEGVRVSDFPNDSPARRAGIRIGDIIVRFDGQPVHTDDELLRFIAEAPVGKTCRVTVVREQQELEISVQLSRRQM
ncbi:MAG: trypsin-like peptidase domain-containing protein [Planctomycetales bacterium]|nr:trypsin-like peptidase domain-containing protein [Planctomycetales bacterium]